MVCSMVSGARIAGGISGRSRRATHLPESFRESNPRLRASVTTFGQQRVCRRELAANSSSFREGAGAGRATKAAPLSIWRVFVPVARRAPVERARGNAEQFRRLLLVAARPLERVGDQDLLGLRDRTAARDRDARNLRRLRARVGPEAQVLGFESGAGGDDDSALQHVLELAHVARPGMGGEAI